MNYTDGMRDYLTQFICEDDREEFARKTAYEVVLHEIRRQPVYSVIYRRQYQGRQEYFQVSFTAAGSGENNDFIVGFKNVNDVVLAERQKNAAHTEALAAAEYANHAKTQFPNSMSHDIRTPMNAIIGFTSLAASHIDNKEEVWECLRKIGTSSEHLFSLINDVLNMSRTQPGRYDLILMDVQMPVMNGYEATRQIRSMNTPYCKEIPILAMTANAFEKDRQDAIAAGMNGHLAKPIDLSVLLKTLSEILA